MVAKLTPVPFSQLKQGMRARVVQVTGDSGVLTRLQEMGLTEGAEFWVDKIAPLGDPVEIFIRGYRLCLRRSETAGILVEAISE